jgi:hypothetical protein
MPLTPEPSREPFAIVQRIREMLAAAGINLRDGVSRRSRDGKDDGAGVIR